MPQILCIHVGQTGVQIANALWEVLCIEHGVRPDGCLQQCFQDRGYYDTLFEVSRAGKAIPRAVMVDLEPNVIDEIRCGSYRCLFAPDLLLSGKEGAANNYARGYYNIGKEMIDLTLDRIRRVAEVSPNLQGILISRSLGGGTGSGFTALLLERLSEDYGRKSKFLFSVYPAPKVVSTATASFRFHGPQVTSITELQTNLLPYPRIHYPVMSYAPLIGRHMCAHQITSLNNFAMDCVRPCNQLVTCDIRNGMFLACCMHFRGDVGPTIINNSVQQLMSDRTVRFVEWSPTGLKVIVSYQPPSCIPGGNLAPTRQAVCMMCNNTVIKVAWSRLLKKHKILYKKRAFVHHYVGEGMEESEFKEAVENVAALIQEYVEVEK